MGKDLVFERSKAKDVPRGYWRWNIKNPYTYARQLARQVKQIEKKPLSPSRLKISIEEDSHQKITLADCRAIMRKAGA